MSKNKSEPNYYFCIILDKITSKVNKQTKDYKFSLYRDIQKIDHLQDIFSFANELYFDNIELHFHVHKQSNPEIILTLYSIQYREDYQQENLEGEIPINIKQIIKGMLQSGLHKYTKTDEIGQFTLSYFIYISDLKNGISNIITGQKLQYSRQIRQEKNQYRKCQTIGPNLDQGSDQNKISQSSAIIKNKKESLNIPRQKQKMDQQTIKNGTQQKIARHLTQTQNAIDSSINTTDKVNQLNENINTQHSKTTIMRQVMNQIPEKQQLVSGENLTYHQIKQQNIQQKNIEVKDIHIDNEKLHQNNQIKQILEKQPQSKKTNNKKNKSNESQSRLKMIIIVLSILIITGGFTYLISSKGKSQKKNKKKDKKSNKNSEKNKN